MNGWRKNGSAQQNGDLESCGKIEMHTTRKRKNEKETGNAYNRKKENKTGQHRRNKTKPRPHTPTKVGGFTYYMYVLNMYAICIYICIIYVCGCQKKHEQIKICASMQ